jgi:hypothetical protein
MKTEHDNLGIIICLHILASMYFKCPTKSIADCINTYVLEKKYEYRLQVSVEHDTSL